MPFQHLFLLQFCFDGELMVSYNGSTRSLIAYGLAGPGNWTRLADVVVDDLAQVFGLRCYGRRLLLDGADESALQTVLLYTLTNHSIVHFGTFVSPEYPTDAPNIGDLIFVDPSKMAVANDYFLAVNWLYQTNLVSLYDVSSSNDNTSQAEPLFEIDAGVKYTVRDLALTNDLLFIMTLDSILVFQLALPAPPVLVATLKSDSPAYFYTLVVNNYYLAAVDYWLQVKVYNITQPVFLVRLGFSFPFRPKDLILPKVRIRWTITLADPAFRSATCWRWVSDNQREFFSFNFPHCPSNIQPKPADICQVRPRDCAAGQYIEVDFTPTTDRSCTDCRNNTFSSEVGDLIGAERCV
jgi:hypothetical protein